MAQRNYLATTGVHELWGTDAPIVYLGPWCLTGEGAQKLVANKTIQVVPSPWKPAAKIKEAAEYCYEQYDSLLPALAECLNAAHTVSYPLCYWRILIGPWLLHFIEALYDRYKRIENAVGLYPGIYTHILLEKDCNPSVDTTYEFLGRRVYDDTYNLVLFSLIIRRSFPELGVEKPYDMLSVVSRKDNRCGKPLGRLGQIKLNIKKICGDPLNLLNHHMNLISPRPRVVLSDMYHISSAEKIMMLIRSLFKIQFVDFKKKSPCHAPVCSSGLRKHLQLATLHKDDAFHALLCEVIPKSIPRCYIENYLAYQKAVSSLVTKKKAQAVGSSIGWYFNEPFKFYAAEQAAGNAMTVDFQHGGGYGMSLSVPTETLSREKNIFFTWGWRDEQHVAIVLLPSPHLSRMKDTHRCRCDSLVFVGTVMPKYHYRFFTGLQPEDMSGYFESRKRFFLHIDSDIRDKVLYRPYDANDNLGWHELQLVAEACPEAELLKEGSLIRWMRHAKLVVIDHPHTSFIEALTINVPSVFYWDHEVFLMRSEAEPYFQLLRDAEILHTTPESAARKVNAVFDNPQAWWQLPKVQHARNEFCRQFAYARRDWMSVWMETLIKIAK